MLLPYNRLLLIGILFLLQPIFASTQPVPSCDAQLKRLGGEHYDPLLPQAWEVSARALANYLSEMSSVSDGVLNGLRGKGNERDAASCYKQLLFVTPDAMRLFVFDVMRGREVAAFDVIGFPKEISAVTVNVLALTLHQAVANAGDGIAVIDVQRDSVLYTPPPSRYGAVVPVLVAPGKGVLIEEANWGAGRLYRRLNFLELTEREGARLLEPGCIVDVPNGFSGLLSLQYALTDTGLVALGDAAGDKEETKPLPNCQAVADRLR